MLKKLFIPLLMIFPLFVYAQIGDHRNDLSIGVNGGYALSSIGFTPKVTQGQHGGLTGGLSFRYVCEKYFSTICSIYAEVNYTQAGWKESIVDIDDNPVVNEETGEEEKYSRNINYVQVPLLAHLAWGKERRGMQFFLEMGPQFGYWLSESTDTNFTLENMNIDDRANTESEQYTMDVENKFDYGIAVGTGIECSIPKIGHFLVGARYYYGLGNIYGNSKRDNFAKSNYGIINFKISYLFDITKTK